MKFSYLLIVALVALRFFGAIPIPGVLIFLFMIATSYQNILKESRFRTPIIWVIIFSIISVFTCKYFRGQAPMLTFRTMSPYLMIFSYFFFINKRISIEKMEKLIYVLSIIFVVCYIIQYVLYPHFAIFPDAAEDYEGETRIRLNGQNICSLGLFYAVNKYLVYKKKKFLILSLFCYLTMFLWGFRSITFGCIAFILFLLYRVRGMGKIIKLLPLFIFAALIMVQIPMVSEKLAYMMERQENGQTFANDDYIRVILIKYFYQDHFQSPMEMFWGSGIPADSPYGLEVESLADEGMHWIDMGLLGLSWMLGIPAALCMLWYAIKAVFSKLPKEYIYLSVWFLFLTCIAFTTAEFVRIGNYIPQAIALAMIVKVYSLQKRT